MGNLNVNLNVYLPSKALSNQAPIFKMQASSFSRNSFFLTVCRPFLTSR